MSGSAGISTAGRAPPGPPYRLAPAGPHPCGATRGLPPTPTNRGTEQGDTLAPAQAGLVLADLGREVCQAVHRAHAQGDLPWMGAGDDAAIHFAERSAAWGCWDARGPWEYPAPGGQVGETFHPGDAPQRQGGIVAPCFF